MRTFVRTGAIAIALTGLTTAAHAEGVADMFGKWKWTDFTVECKEAGANGISCIVIDGPKNKGMEMVQSKLEPKDGAYVGDIKHPASGEVYKAKMSLKDPNTFSMDGCTAAGVCAQGDFTRVK